MRAAVILLAFLALSRDAQGEVRLAKVFTDHMVLQQQKPIRIWGWALPGESVTAAFNGTTARTVADNEGHWRVEVPAMAADGKPHTLVIRGSNSIELKDVLLGEVWLAVGQSNMSRGLRYVKDRALADPMRATDYRLLFIVQDQVPRAEEVGGMIGWAPATHESMEHLFTRPDVGPYEYSEVAYEFGKALHEKLNVPVGMIASAYGGTTAAQWTPADDPAARFDIKSGKPDTGPGGMYQAMLVGIPPLAIRGVICYQGENDGGNSHYADDLTKLIAGLRKKFEAPDLPFDMAQIAQTTFHGGVLSVDEAQREVFDHVPHTAIAASNDLWDGQNPAKAAARLDKETGWPVAGGSNPHPPNKNIIAARLARIALGQTYDNDVGETLGPMVESFAVHGDAIAVKFKFVGKGLKTDDGQPPNWFEIAGADGVYRKADATISGPDTVVLHNETVKSPANFRFAWNPLARHNLYNSEGIPAFAYRSDHPSGWRSH